MYWLESGDVESRLRLFPIRVSCCRRWRWSFVLCNRSVAAKAGGWTACDYSRRVVEGGGREAEVVIDGVVDDASAGKMSIRERGRC